MSHYWGSQDLGDGTVCNHSCPNITNGALWALWFCHSFALPRLLLHFYAVTAALTRYHGSHRTDLCKHSISWAPSPPQHPPVGADSQQPQGQSLERHSPIPAVLSLVDSCGERWCKSRDAKYESSACILHLHINPLEVSWQSDLQLPKLTNTPFVCHPPCKGE